MKSSVERYHALDGLRGVAAIMVVFYHFGLPFFDPIGVFADNFLVSTSYGFVDLFFVLSGFVIAANYSHSLKNKVALKHYMIKRFARLYPLLLFTVLIYMALKGYAMYAGFEFDTPNYNITDYLIDIVEPLTFMNSTTLISSSVGMNPPSWSISAEMIAYLVFGIVMLYGKGNRYIFYFLIIGCVGFVVLNGRFTYASDYGFVRGILGFSIGVIAFRNRNLQLGGIFHELMFILMLPVFFYIIHSTGEELTNLLLLPLFFYGIVAFSQEKGLFSRVLNNSFFQYLGKISYSIYLMHFIVLWTYYKVAWDIIKLEPNTITTWFSITLILLIVIAVSHFTYRFIEKKGMVFIRKRLLKYG